MKIKNYQTKSMVKSCSNTLTDPVICRLEGPLLIQNEGKIVVILAFFKEKG